MIIIQPPHRKILDFELFKFSNDEENFKKPLPAQTDLLLKFIQFQFDHIKGTNIPTKGLIRIIFELALKLELDAVERLLEGYLIL